MKSTIYLVQLDCVWEDKAANFDRVTALLDEEKPDAGSLIVMPEMFATGFSMNTAATRQGADRETERYLRTLAKKHCSAVIGGLVSEAASGRCHNESVCFDANGDELARYAKMQPFSLGGESAVHEAGAAITTFEWSGLKIAPFICYDLRFPELAREAVLKHGAEMLIYIASWPIKRHQHWLTLLQARAIENLCCVVGVNRCGTDPFFSYPGRSGVVDPHGVIIADAGAREGVVRVRIEPEEVTGWRAEFPALQDAQ